MPTRRMALVVVEVVVELVPQLQDLLQVLRDVLLQGSLALPETVDPSLTAGSAPSARGGRGGVSGRWLNFSPFICTETPVEFVSNHRQYNCKL